MFCVSLYLAIGVSFGLSVSTDLVTRTSTISEDEGKTVEVCLKPSLGPPSSASTLSVVSEDGTAVGMQFICFLIELVCGNNNSNGS